MTTLNQVFKCEICGNTIEIVNNGAGTLVCCSKEMKTMPELKGNEGWEKHVPVIETTEKGIHVKVGAIPHPMEDNHFIQWIEVLGAVKACRRRLKPGDDPEANFPNLGDVISVRSYCNIHGLRRN